MTFKYLLKSGFWLLPFIACMLGYYIASWLVPVVQLPAPAVVGQPLAQALMNLSSMQLHAQVVAEKEDADLPEGTIIDQQPCAGHFLKQSQPLYLTITRKPAPLRAPQLIDADVGVVESYAKNLSLRIKYHELESNYPTGRCFAQFPAAGDAVVDRTVHVYLSSGLTPKRIFPDLRGRAVEDVVAWLATYGIKPHVMQPATGSGLVAPQALVLEQRPLPGTIVDLTKPIAVQLQVVA